MVLVNGSQWKQIGLVLLLLTSATARCGRRPPAEASPEAEWSLTVINRHWLDVNVHVISDGQRTHVGLVPAVRTETYVLRPQMVAHARTVRLEANAVGSAERATSEAVLVRAGQHVEWMLENGLGRTSVTVW